MHLTDNPTFYVFQLDDNHFEALGQVNQVKSVVWPTAYIGCGEFELWAALTPDMAELLKTGNVVWLDGDTTACLIETVNPSYDENGDGTIDVKGRTLECLLTRRTINGTWKVTNKPVSTIMRQLVTDNFISPDNDNRILPFLKLGAAHAAGGLRDSYQKTGGEVLEALENLGENYNVGFSVDFDPVDKSLVFNTRQGVDRTIGQSKNDPVVFSTDMSDILTSTYTKAVSGKKTVAKVYGEAEAGYRSVVTVGDDSGMGFERYELYVDARDLQSEVYDEDGTSHQLTEDEYLAMLVERGLEKLSECVEVESFDANVRPLKDASFVYGVDYEVGDKVTFVDDRLGVTINARIEQVQAEYSETYTLSLVVGYEAPTIMEQVKRAASY